MYSIRSVQQHLYATCLFFVTGDATLASLSNFRLLLKQKREVNTDFFTSIRPT